MLLHQTFVENVRRLTPDHPDYAHKACAAQCFEKQGFPGADNEYYKYTALSGPWFAERSRASTEGESHLRSVLPDALDAYRVVLEEGRVTQSTLPDTLSSKIQVLPFAAARVAPNFAAYFGRIASSELDPLIALNTVGYEGGCFVQIAPEAVLDKPLWLQHRSCRSNQAVCPRVLVVAGPQSCASVMTSWSIGRGVVNAVTEVVLQAGARLNWYNVQTDLATRACLFNTTHVAQKRDSTCTAHTLTWSGNLVRNSWQTFIEGSGSETHLYGLYCPLKTDHIDNTTTVDHRHPHSTSNELFKGLIGGEGTGIFNGRVYVRPEAQKTLAFQANHNLLLSEQAVLHTKPQLEIWADDVKCSHGATIGKIDPKQLAYLQARGIPHAVARRLLQEAFAADVINKMDWVELRALLHKDLQNTLQNFASNNLGRQASDAS